MSWQVEYYEQNDSAQPAETFEDTLLKLHPKLAGKLARIRDQIKVNGHGLGGGLIEKCHDYSNLWEARTIFNGWLARELFAFDGNRAVLLHGYLKRSGEAASTADLDRANRFLMGYQQTHKISPALGVE